MREAWGLWRPLRAWTDNRTLRPRPSHDRLRRADLSPTNVKSPVDADGSHSYFSKKTKDGEDGEGVQMGKFVVKSNLRILDDLVSVGGEAIG